MIHHPSSMNGLYKVDEIKQSVLPEVRSKAGFNASSLFITNVSESLNHIIKREVEWKEAMLPQLIESLRAIAEDQVCLLENAVVGHGEWHLTEQHNGLAISKSRWFSNMSSENTKKLHMRKVFNAKPVSSFVN